MLLEPLHFLFVFIGINANIILIVCIIWASPVHIKEYSLILLNSALNDLLADVSDTLTWQRVVFSGTSWANLSYGPCLVAGRSLCVFLTQLLVISLLHSQFLLAISFWYRSRIMVKSPIGTKRLQILLFVALLPTIAHTALMISAESPLSDVQTFVRNTFPIHDGDTDDRVLTGFLSILEPRSAIMLAYFGVIPIPLYCFIIVTRQRNLHLIERLSFRSSTHVRILHRRLIQALTYHALLPSAIIVAVILFGAMSLLGYDHYELQELVYLSAALPSILNPIFTIYLIGPYKRFIIRVFKLTPDMKISTTSSSGNRLDTTNIR